MFKIYVDDRLITIASSQVPLKNANLVLKLNGSEKKGELSKLIKSFIEEIQLPSLSLISDAPDKTWETFCSLYRILEAAGGVVFNKEKQLLMIYRNEHWDLPKGKIEINENHAEAANVK